MRYREWITMLCISGFGMMFANKIGFSVAFKDSLSGVIVLLAISLCAVVLDDVLPFNLSIIAYCSILGVIAACPVSPISGYVINAANQINFTAPLTMVGAYAGMSISNNIKQFVKQGWKMIIITIFVMTGTFVGSLLIGQVILSLTGGI